VLGTFKTTSSTCTIDRRLLSPEKIREALGIPGPRREGFIEALPFTADDVTAGCENELQVAVAGDRWHADLPLAIQNSNYFGNIVKRVASGDTSRKAVTDLENYLESNAEGIWENSWVRFPKRRLSSLAAEILHSDLLADKTRPDGDLRGDAGKFLNHSSGEEFVRVPISYLLKLSLADVLGSQNQLPERIVKTGRRIMGHLLNDNTSPETHSFHIVMLRGPTGLGRALAKETAKRFLLTQLLGMYANRAFELEERGQRALIYFSPHPPIRQKELNDCISDSFYRELFMSPCLSGWDNGLEKHDYMCLCHQVLSRSQLNAVAKLREAGIITRNLVVLPTVSNISLANNGTHISLGSLKLSRHLAQASSSFTRMHEKYLGDLVIKIVEHFLPLFVGTYSAAPYRLAFSDFHPEKVLGFLPHELDYTHLRMVWRRWKKKAHLKILGRPLTPFGLPALDRVISSAFRIRGDFVPDFRLVDYPVCLMSTDKSPACDGAPGNEERLKKDLVDLGVFDDHMRLYLPYRLREFAAMGFSGFEGRHYSLFGSLKSDLAHATNLQALVTALAFKYALQGMITHAHIPDTPSTESERRQVFFAAAIGLPTFYVSSDTGNLLMRKLIDRTRGVRYSRRYAGYRRVYLSQFRLALAETLVADASDLIELMGMGETIADLMARVKDYDECSVAGKLSKAILDQTGAASPLHVEAKEFNMATERYYRDTLRRDHVQESFRFMEEDLRDFDRGVSPGGPNADAIRLAIGETEMSAFLASVKEGVMTESASADELRKLINVLLLSISHDISHTERALHGTVTNDSNSAPVYRAAYGEDLHRTASVG